MEKYKPSSEEVAKAEGMMSEEQKGMSEQREKELKEYWGVETLEEVKDIAPSQFHPDKKWMATHFKIEKPDGTSEEVESTKTILKIKNKDGMEIEVPAFATHHIMSLHLKGEEAGSTMEGGSLETSFGVVAEHLPRELPFKGESAAFEMDVKQTREQRVLLHKQKCWKKVSRQKKI